MMTGLIPGSGKFRSSGVGVFEGEELVHMAPHPPLDLFLSKSKTFSHGMVD